MTASTSGETLFFHEGLSPSLFSLAFEPLFIVSFLDVIEMLAGNAINLAGL